MALLRSEVEKAQAELDKATALADTHARSASAKRAARQKVLDAVGETLLADPGAESRLRREIDDLQSGAEFATLAESTARGRLPALQRALGLAKAQEVSKEAARVRSEAEKLQNVSRKLLVQLGELEGCAYGPVPPPPPPVFIRGEWTHDGTPLPKSAQLFEQARILDEQADRMRAAANGAPLPPRNPVLHVDGNLMGPLLFPPDWNPDAA